MAADDVDTLDSVLDKYIPPDELAFVKRMLYGKELRYELSYFW